MQELFITLDHEDVALKNMVCMFQKIEAIRFSRFLLSGTYITYTNNLVHSGYPIDSLKVTCEAPSGFMTLESGGNPLIFGS